jgi:pilus assembly protein TadC
MTPYAVVAGGIVVAALMLVAVRRPAARGRLRAVVVRPLRRRPGKDPERLRVWLIRAGAALAGLAVAVLIGGWAGAGAGVVTVVVADRLLRRLEPAAARADRLRAEGDLPLAADLLAAALRSGAPTGRAVEAVATALGGPLGARLAQVGRALRLGATADEAWAYLAPVAGAERLIRAAVRSSDSGAALAGALARLADDLRAGRGVAAEARARRAGVLIVLPLGLCFLPAFVLAGLLPVIVAVLGDVL